MNRIAALGKLPLDLDTWFIWSKYLFAMLELLDIRIESLSNQEEFHDKESSVPLYLNSVRQRHMHLTRQAIGLKGWHKKCRNTFIFKNRQ